MGREAEQSVVSTRGLTKRYREVVAVDGLDLSVEEGEVFGFLGPNGAGKTTTILMLLGLTEPTTGSAEVAGHDPVREPLAVKSVVGYLPENVGFYPDLTGRQNLSFTARLNGIPRRVAEERMDALLRQVGLENAADRAAGKYSRGMRQRLGIADALIKEPSILILDEPTIGLDPDGIREFLELIRGLSRDRGITVILSSHLLHQVQEVCDRVGILVRGKLMAVGPVETLGRQLDAGSDSEMEIGFGPEVSAEEAEQALRGLQGVQELTRETDYWLVRSDGDLRREAVSALWDRGMVPVHLRLRHYGLNEIYVHYFREGVEPRG